MPSNFIVIASAKTEQLSIIRDSKFRRIVLRTSQSLSVSCAYTRAYFFNEKPQTSKKYICHLKLVDAYGIPSVFIFSIRLF